MPCPFPSIRVRKELRKYVRAGRWSRMDQGEVSSLSRQFRIQIEFFFPGANRSHNYFACLSLFSINLKIKLKTLSMSNFWKEFNAPIFSLAPMEDVTDTVFREIVLRLSAPGHLHVVFTEFCNVEGLNHPNGRERVSERLILI